MKHVLCLLFSIFIIAGCTGPKTSGVVATPQFVRASYQDLPGWQDDNLETAFQAFLTSCETLLKQPATTPFQPIGTVGDFHAPCRVAQGLSAQNERGLRKYFENWFDPYLIAEKESGDTQGLFTGYYEASLKGSFNRYGPYQTPLYAVPQDLYTADLGQWYKELEGKKITAQVQEGQLRRYPSRARIVAEGLPAAEVIVWVDDPVDAFFLQIQGSGVVKLDNGQNLRVGYAGKNGHAYYAIGRALIERGVLTKENVSLQTIRKWMEDNPDQADDLMNLNPSYVFFRPLETAGPVGAQGVVLTRLRSLAVDNALYDYGLPVWLRIENPQEGRPDIARMMIAQDTGGAIKGVVRGDFFWGFGKTAEEMAGKMKSRGQYWFFLPKTISANEFKKLGFKRKIR